MTDYELTDEQIDVLYACRDHGGAGNVEVLQADDVQKTKKLLAAALSASKGMDAERAESIPLGVLADQLYSDIREGETSIEEIDLTEQTQQPETGGASTTDREGASNPFGSSDESDLEDALEAADAGTRRDAVKKLATAASVESRLPKRAAELRSEAASALEYDAEPDAIAAEALECGVESDPRELDSLAL